MAECQGHVRNLGRIAPQRNASGCISVVVLKRKIGNNSKIVIKAHDLIAKPLTLWRIMR
jgi:hypothetical protein